MTLHRYNIIAVQCGAKLKTISKRGSKMKMRCPICGQNAEVSDPYEKEEIKRASAWFASHDVTLRGKRTKCNGSQTVAIERKPILAVQR